jgi:hypothetical protein
MPSAAKKLGLYAAATTVTPEQSQMELARIVKSRGATQHHFGEAARGAVFGFTARGRQIRFTVPYPEEGTAGRDQEIRRRWRCMVIAVKAKFEAVEVAGTLSPEEQERVFRAEFLGATVMPDGRTVADLTLPLVEAAYASGKMPRQPLLGAWEGDDGDEEK